MPRPDHCISRDNISVNALKVLRRLQKGGYSAYLVGGSVRDLLLDRKPKDFDIATSALPEEVDQLFRNSRLIGRRFRLVHVYFKSEVIEVSTFRANTQGDLSAVNEQTPAMICSDNIYGTIEEDAWRRDFTVNAMYYNIVDFSVDDFTGGLNDLKRRQLRMIGDPVQRYHEDPVRLLRAIRHSAKLKFSIEPNTEAPIREQSHLLQHVPPARLLDEVLKLFFEGNAELTYEKLLHYGYMNVLFPQTHATLHNSDGKATKRMLKLAIQETDKRFHEGKSLNPSYLLAVFLWPAFQLELNKQLDEGSKLYQVLHHVMHDVIAKQSETVMIPRRMEAMIRSVWLMQYQLERRRRSRIYHIAGHRYFRAALDFLELRAKSGTPVGKLAKWWREFEKAGTSKRQKILKALKK